MTVSFILQVLGALAYVGVASSTPLVYDGRAPYNLTKADINSSIGPYLTVVKGSENATHYSTLLGHTLAPTPLWDQSHILNLLPTPIEQPISITIDNTSIFIPGSGGPQNGFRRTEFIAQTNNDHTAFDASSEVGTTVYHFSIFRDEKWQLNYTHEYQIVFIEPNDGSHVFGIQLGSPFTDPTGPLPEPNAHSFKVLDHALNILFMTTFSPSTWHNFAVQVDWVNLKLGVFYSTNDENLKAVTDGLVPNPTTPTGADGQGDFHFGVLKLPLVNPADTPTDQGDVVHFGIQEGTKEGLTYSGVFVENVSDGVSVGHGKTVEPLE